MRRRTSSTPTPWSFSASSQPERSPHRPVVGVGARIGRNTPPSTGLFRLALVLGASLALAGCGHEVGTPAERAAAIQAVRMADEPPNALRRAADCSFAGDRTGAASSFLDAGEAADASPRLLTSFEWADLQLGAHDHLLEAKELVELRRAEVVRVGLALLDEATRLRADHRDAEAARREHAVLAVVLANARCSMHPTPTGAFPELHDALAQRGLLPATGASDPTSGP